MVKKLLHNRVWILIVLMLAILFPTTINKPAETNVRAVVVGMGLDLTEDNQIEVSAEVVVPEYNLGFNDNIQVFSATGASVLEAMEILGLHIGKIAGLGNMSVIVISEEIGNRGIGELMDFFLRSKRMNDNALLVATNGKAKDLLEKISKADDSFTLSLNNISKYNDAGTITSDCTLEEFLDDYYSIYETSIIPIIELTDDPSTGIDTEEISGSGASGNSGGGASSQQTGGSSDGGASGSSTSSGGKVVSNNGKSRIFKKGKAIFDIGPEEAEGYNVLKQSSDRGIYRITNVSDYLYDNANITFSIVDKKTTHKISFSKAGIPRLNYKIEFTLKTEHIEQDKDSTLILNADQRHITPTVKSKLQDLLKGYVSTSLAVGKEYDADFFKFQREFEKYTPNKWNKYLKSLKQGESAFSKIEVFVDVVIKEFL